MKITKEERELRKIIRNVWDDYSEDSKGIMRLITAMRKAIIEECAKVAENMAVEDDVGSLDSFGRGIADAIRGVNR